MLPPIHDTISRGSIHARSKLNTTVAALAKEEMTEAVDGVRKPPRARVRRTRTANASCCQFPTYQVFNKKTGNGSQAMLPWNDVNDS